MAQCFEVKNGATSSLVPTTSWGGAFQLFGTVADRNDDSAYGWTAGTGTVTLPASGLADGYLFLWGFEFEDSSNGRLTIAGRMQQTGGTGSFVTAQTGGYCRDTSEDRAYVSGWSFVDNPSASSTFQFQWKRDSDAPNTTDGTVRSYLQVIPFYYSDIGLYTSTSTTATGGTTPTQISGFTGTDGTNITISSSQVSVTGDNKRYLVLGSAYHDGMGSIRTQRWYGLEIDGSYDLAAQGCMYYRDSSNDLGGESFIRLIETATATRTIEVNQYRGIGVAAGEGGADVDGNTTSTEGAHALVVIELNDSAEVFSSIDSTGGQELTGTGPVDIDIASTADIEFNDSASFTRSTDTGVNVESTMDLLVFANVSHAREASGITSGARWTVHGEFTVNGTEVTDAGFHGNFNRGNQSSQDCFGSSCNMALLYAATSGDDIGVSQQQLTGTEGGGGDIETQPGWVGFGLINLDTLAPSGATDNLLADDVESDSEVSSPAIGQVHALLADDVESASELTSPAIGQTHVLLADDPESASEVSSPAIGQTHALLADDVESASELSAPTLSEANILNATSVESTSELSSPALGQIHALLADDLESASEITAPALSQAHTLLADDVESSSEVSAPAIGQTHVLLADDTESASEVSAPAIGQIHALLATSVESASEVSAPPLSTEGQDALLAEDVESASEVSTPAITQIHALLADDVESTSELSAPVLVATSALLADDVESASEISLPTLTQIHALSATNLESTSELTLPGIGQVHVLTADDIESASQVAVPTLTILLPAVPARRHMQNFLQTLIR